MTRTISAAFTPPVSRRQQLCDFVRAMRSGMANSTYVSLLRKPVRVISRVSLSRNVT